MSNNIITLTDSYKMSHYNMVPSDTQHVYSYFESRGGLFPKTVFFGLQYLLKKYLAGKVVTQDKINRAKKLAKAHFMSDKVFNADLWQYIVDKHDGHLPVEIKAVAEGSVVPTHNVLMTVQNTDPNCYWLTNYLETLLVQTWYPSTVATQSFYMKQIIAKYLKETGDLSGLNFKLHDFGFRGVSSVESAGLGGAAHLINFQGTDTLAGIELADEFYDSGVCGFSIPATEHYVVTSWGKENELKAYANLLEKYPTGLLACVSDSYDLFNACKNLWGGVLYEQVINRDGCLVIRPDSGDPLEILPELLNILGQQFGYSFNSKGYKILPPTVRLIQGDGVEYNTLEGMLESLSANGWSTDNIAFGSGGGLLQKLNRDTSKYAFKCSAVKRSGTWYDVFKDPVTDSGKKSKRGRLKLIKTTDYRTVEFIDKNWGNVDELQTVFKDGVLVRSINFDEIRRRTELAFNESL
jgi:nicotinamide phosphoribosyltransferase